MNFTDKYLYKRTETSRFFNVIYTGLKDLNNYHADLILCVQQAVDCYLYNSGKITFTFLYFDLNV